MPATTARNGMVMLAAAAWCMAAATGRAGDAVTWLEAAAERPVDHAVMIRGPFTAGPAQVALTGPVAIVTTGATADDAACYTAYRIAAPADEPARDVGVGADARLRVGPAEFLLVPAKRLADGPAPAGGATGVYELRPILDPPAAVDGVPARGRRPTHVGLPVDYRHHFERVPVTDPGRGLVLFAADEADAAPAAVSVVDDFGTNRLVPGRTTRTGAWITVRAGAAP